MMSTDESKNTTGKLQATGTSVPGFSTTDVSFQKNLSDKGYSFDGRMATEQLGFFMRTLDVKENVSYDIQAAWSGDKETALAYYKSAEGVTYDGVSGTIVFKKFDDFSESAEFEARLKLESATGDFKDKVVVLGEFVGFEGP